MDKEANIEESFADRDALLARLDKHFKSEDPNFHQILLVKVDESDFSLADWIESLVVLRQWLERSGSYLSPKDALGYVACAAKSVSNSALYNQLPSLVDDFLKQYGCELAVKKQD